MMDYNDFALKLKDAMTTWGNDNYSVDVSSDVKFQSALILTQQSQGYGILCGLVFGKTATERGAFVWYLSQDLCSPVFLDPRTGQEYTGRALEIMGFETLMCTF